MTTPADFWSVAATEADPVRENGNPMLVPEAFEGKEPVVRQEYTRASGLADHIEPKEHIHLWEMRYLARAMGQNEDLAALAACETYSTGVETDNFTYQQKLAKSASGRRLDSIIERALDRARIHEKADRGTAVHGFTEPGAPAGDAIPARMQSAVAAFWEINRRECIEIVGTEMFTANDVTRSAGTFDHLVRVHGHPDLTGYVVADKKTGRFDPLSWVIQISSYANGKVYDTATDRRVAWPGEINQDFGIVWQIDCKEPAAGKPDPGPARAKLWVIDLKEGWRLAQIAAEVRDLNNDPKGLASDYKAPSFKKRLALCNTREALTALWHSLDEGDPRLDQIAEKGKTL